MNARRSQDAGTSFVARGCIESDTTERLTNWATEGNRLVHLWSQIVGSERSTTFEMFCEPENSLDFSAIHFFIGKIVVIEPFFIS